MNLPANDRARNPSTQVTFSCTPCQYQWQAEPARVEPAPERGHPFAYFAVCPICREEAPQIAWEIGMMSRWARATGPKTDAGKAKSAANLEGHPTPEEALRTRYNALKHGLSARQAKFFPARPGKYPHCKTCDIDHFVCRAQPACLKRTELFMRHHVAFELQDPDLLTEIQADMQAGVSALIEDMLLAIISDGVAIKEPKGGYDKDGFFRLAQFMDENGDRHVLTELKANPLLKVLGEYLSRNNLNLADLNMTPKVKVDQDMQMGHLQRSDEDRESLLDLQKKQATALESLMGYVQRSRARMANDPVLLEHQESEGEHDE